MNGTTTVECRRGVVLVTRAEAPADWDDLESPETYIGHARAERRTDDPPASLRTNHWSLLGDWMVKEQGAVLNEPGGGIAYRFHARDLHLAMNQGTTPVPFRVSLDGEAPGDSHGDDVDPSGNGLAIEPRLYQLIRQRGRIEDRTFEITFSSRGSRPACSRSARKREAEDRAKAEVT
jgi:Thioredoxin like C-terminal domain